MRKLYPFSLLLLSVSFSFAQQTGINNSVQDSRFSIDRLVPIQKGDSFFVRPDLRIAKKSPFLTNVFRALGVAGTAYGISHIPETKSNINLVRKPVILPEAGLAVFLTAPKLSSAIVHSKTYLQYLIYDKDGNLVSTGVIPVTRQILKRNDGYIPGAEITVNGFLRAVLVGSYKTTDNNLGLEINIIPSANAGKTEEIYARPNFSPINVTVIKDQELTSINPGMIIAKLSSPSSLNHSIVAGKLSNENGISLKSISVKLFKNSNTAKSKAMGQLRRAVLLDSQSKATEAKRPLSSKQKGKSPVFHKGLLYVRLGKEDVEREDASSEKKGTEDDEILMGFQPDNVPPTDDDDGADDDDEGDSDVSFDDDFDYDGGDDDDGGDADDDDDDDDADDGDDGDDDDGEGIVSGPIVYFDDAGNEYILDPGYTYELPDGETVTVNEDGTIQQVTMGTVTVTSTINKSTGEIALEAVTLGEDTQSATFSGIELASEAGGILSDIGGNFTIASIITGGLPAAINIIRELYNGEEISLRDAVSLFMAVLAALGLAFGLSELIQLAIALGSTIIDIIELLNG